ncbi:MAG TPA: DUF3631 domain-containing protein [Nitrososphaera sp.]|jgi:hypothetical protein
MTVLNDIYDFLGRFIVYPSDEARVANTLWVAHTYLMDVWEHTPRLAFLSPERECGKSRALEATSLLCPRPVISYNATPAYLYRKIGEGVENGIPPTIFYDELDTIFNEKSKGDTEGLRGLFNAGYQRGATAGRCVTKGNKIETEDFPAYCALALSGIGNLPDTILSRSVIIRMRRRKKDEYVEPFRRRDLVGLGDELRERMSIWAEEIRTRMNPRPRLPEGIEDRAADVWETLVSIADEAKGEWPERARVAAVTLVAASREKGGDSLSTRLLHDLRSVYEKEDRLHTIDIINKLILIEEAPWGSIKGKAIDSNLLAELLNPFGVYSKNIRINNIIRKGYDMNDLSDAFDRYLPPAAPPSPGKALQPLQPLQNPSHIPLEGVTGVTTEPDPSSPPVKEDWTDWDSPRYGGRTLRITF